MRISAALPRGVSALLFESARRRRALEAAWVARLEAAAFEEIVLPILDYSEPYEPLLGAAARRELYRFVGRDGELLALRADFTPMLARLLAPQLEALDVVAHPLRLFYRGDVVRFAEERAGRPRESYQLGAELLGVAGEAAEVEMLRLFLELLSARGTEGSKGANDASMPSVVIGVAGALDALLLAAADETGSDPNALTAAVARRERASVRRMAGSRAAALLEIVERGLPQDLAAFAASRADAAGESLVRWASLVESLRREFPRLDLTIDLAEFAQQTLDPRLAEAVGERSYYDGLVFRATAGGLSIGGGGRYDSLFERLGARTPAVGFSLGLDGLLAKASSPLRSRSAA